ncbi:hypothetical protein VKT23_014717 [Stygiomarasmius scandens]|uniref:Uncharacterized protein n=1 Tax=Marasmiellus scandens TaxID=2682957 RepID=A0ABR1IZJ5_9AGAR
MSRTNSECIQTLAHFLASRNRDSKTLMKDEWLGWRPKLSDVKRDMAMFEPYGPDAQSINPPTSSSKNHASTPLKPALRTRSIRSLESQVGDALSLSLSEPRVHFTPPSKAKTRATSKGTGSGNDASTPETPTRRLVMDSVMVPRCGLSDSPYALNESMSEKEMIHYIVF